MQARIYGKTPHPLFGPICVPYLKWLNLWFDPCRILILSNKGVFILNQRLSHFQGSMGWLKKRNFWVTSDDSWVALAQAWIIIW